jgi:hypothetical protein
MTVSAASARSRVAVGLAAGALLLTGCTESVEEASGDFCSNLDTLEAELASLESLVAGDATLDDIDAQREAVRDAYDATAASAGDLDEAVSSEADSAYDSYQDSLGEIPGDASLSEAAPQYAAAAQGYLASLATIAQDAGCETSSS